MPIDLHPAWMDDGLASFRDAVVRLVETEMLPGDQAACRRSARVFVDDCLQLFGSYGYMNEYLIGRMYVDARIRRIYGGTNEIMKEVISRGL